MENDFLKNILNIQNPKKERICLSIGIGLQDADGIASKYLIETAKQNIEGEYP